MSGSHPSTRSPSAVSRAVQLRILRRASGLTHHLPEKSCISLGAKISHMFQEYLGIRLISFPMATLGSKIWSFQERTHLNFTWIEKRAVVIKWRPCHFKRVHKQSSYKIANTFKSLLSRQMAALSTGNLSTRKKQVFYFRWKLPRNSSFWLWNGQCMFFWKLDSCYRTNSPPALGHGFAFDHRLLVPFALLEDNKGWFCQKFLSM